MSTKAIHNLGQLLRHVPGARIQLRCRQCPHVATFAASDLAGFLGHGRSLKSLRFRCECGSRDVERRYARPPARAAPARPRPIDEPS
jgi:hypothetical protein